MASQSPPKPWEKPAPGVVSSAPPPLPERPQSIGAIQAPNYPSPSYPNRFGSVPYLGATSSFAPAGYSRYNGAGYGSMYGGMSSFGNMYGGNLLGGIGGMADPNNLNGMSQSFGQSAQATFQLIENIVNTFGGFAQMLESTYMASRSSFFAIVSITDQLGKLRSTLSSVLGIFTLLQWMRNFVDKICGRLPKTSPKELTFSNFANFAGANGNPTTRISRRPLLIFLAAVLSLPYLVGKLIKSFRCSQNDGRVQEVAANPIMSIDGHPALGQNQILDPSTLDFCRVLYDFPPETGENSVQGVDLVVKKGDVVAVLSKLDPAGNPIDWWRCRARDGRIGYVPLTYLETIQREPPAVGNEGSRATSIVEEKAMTTKSDLEKED